MNNIKSASGRNSSQLRCSPFGSANKCVSDFANASSKFLASLGTSDMPRTLSEMSKPAFEKGGFINIFKVINMEVKS